MLSIAPKRWVRRLPWVECLLLVLGLLLSAGAAQAFFSEAQDPTSPTTTYGPYGCGGVCEGGCWWGEVENGMDCGFGCACCGCESYTGSMSVWQNVGATCYQNADQSCDCCGGSSQWIGTVSGPTARTTADCG